MRTEDFWGLLLCVFGILVIQALIKRNRLKNGPVEKITVDVLEDWASEDLESELAF